MSRTVRPGTAAFQARTSSRTARAAATSRPSVGSSRNRIHGSLSRPRAKFIFWRWPVDSVLTRCCALLLQPDRLDQLVDALPAVARGQAVELAEHPELLADGQDPVARLLAARDHVHDPADLLRLGARRRSRRSGRVALGRQEQRRQDLDQRRLARAVRAEQAEELARLDLEVDAVEGDDAPACRVDAADAADVDGGRLSGRAGVGHGSPRRGGWGTRSLPSGPAPVEEGLLTPGRWISNTGGRSRGGAVIARTGFARRTGVSVSSGDPRPSSARTGPRRAQEWRGARSCGC